VLDPRGGGPTKGTFKFTKVVHKAQRETLRHTLTGAAGLGNEVTF